MTNQWFSIANNAAVREKTTMRFFQSSAKFTTHADDHYDASNTKARQGRTATGMHALVANRQYVLKLKNDPNYYAVSYVKMNKGYSLFKTKQDYYYKLHPRDFTSILEPIHGVKSKTRTSKSSGVTT